MDCIRRANLDAIWAREPSTIAGNLSQAGRWKASELHWDSPMWFLPWSISVEGHLWDESRLLHPAEVAGARKVGVNSSIFDDSLVEERIL
jgi:hypothetical protein